MISLKNISLDFGMQEIFNNISATIQPNDKIGLVGANGTGKSTLLKAITKQHDINNGEIFVSPSMSIGYIPQEAVLTSNLTVLEHTINSCNILDETQIELKKSQSKEILKGLGFSSDQITQTVNQLSTGWKMRLLLAELLLKGSNL